MFSQTMMARRALVLILGAMLLLLAACGNNADNGNSNANANGSDNGNANAANNASAGNDANGTRSIKDATGTIDITGTPKRIVALEWTYAENALALGVQPVGVADIENYNTWVNVKVPLGKDAQDVGTREEPNLETIASLKPDLIIGIKFRHEAILDQLKGIAPTLLFDPYSEEAVKDQNAEMEETFLAMANALNKQDEGQQVLDNLKSVYADGAEKLKAAGKEGEEVVLTQAWSAQNAATFRLFTNESLPVHVLTQLGLKNGFKSDKVEVYGFATADVEAFPAIQQASLLHMVQKDDKLFDMLNSNKVWKDLTFVKENRIYELGGDTWPFGGPLSMETFVGKVVGALTQ